MITSSTRLDNHRTSYSPSAMAETEILLMLLCQDVTDARASSLLNSWCADIAKGLQSSTLSGRHVISGLPRQIASNLLGHSLAAAQIFAYVLNGLLHTASANLPADVCEQFAV